MGFLTSIFGGSEAALVAVLAILVGLPAVILVGLWALKFFFRSSSDAAQSRVRRIGVIDQIPIDAKRQLVLIRRDDVEHLVMIGGPADVVIEGAIPSPSRQKQERSQVQRRDSAMQPRRPMQERPAPAPVNGHADPGTARPPEEAILAQLESIRPAPALLRIDPLHSDDEWEERAGSRRAVERTLDAIPTRTRDQEREPDRDRAREPVDVHPTSIRHTGLLRGNTPPEPLIPRVEEPVATRADGKSGPRGRWPKSR